MSVEKIADGVVVSLAYRLIVDGQEVEDATADDPLDYLHGAENIVPGLERELTGKKVGDKFTVTLQPEDAYGDYDPDDTEAIEREDLPDGLVPGMEIVLEDDEGYIMEATVSEITDDAVILDFNLPFAGKVVTYEVEVIKLRKAEQEELDHGHPHGLDDEYD